MAHLILNPSLLGSLKDTVVVLTGGATGIGRSTVRLFHRAFSPLFCPALPSFLFSLNPPFDLKHYPNYLQNTALKSFSAT
jgi:hypothetical protein